MSNLLEQASLVLIPSGYAEDIVYSEIPLDGSGDMTLTRASNGTRVNSAGLVEVCPWNLAQYSEDLSNAIYVVRDEVAITDNATTAPNGTSTADLMYISSSGDFRYTAQTFTQPQNIYTISVYAKAQNKNVIWMYIQSSGGYGLIYFDLSDGTMQTTAGATSTPSGTMTAVGNGWYRCTFTLGESIALASGAGVGVCDAKGSVFGTASGTNGVYIWGFQLNIGSTAKPYFPTTDRLNVPRLTYQNGGGGCPSLLLEKQSTNLVLWSEDFTNGAWSKINTSVSANNTTSPDGTQNADKITMASGTSGKSVLQSILQNGTYTLSVFFKYDSCQFVQFFLNDDGDPYANFDIQNGVVGSFANCTSSISNFGNGWYRCSMTYTTTIGTAVVIRTIDTSSASRGESSSNTGSYFVWGAQVEASSYFTSYIPTTSASATRVADAYSRSLSSIASGTAFINITDNVAQGSVGTHVYGPFAIDSASLGLYLSRPDGQRLRLWTGGASTVFQTTETNLKLAMTWDGTNVNVYQNGVKVVTNFAYALTNVNNLFSSPSIESSATIAEIVLFNSVLTDAECISLTS